MIDGEYWLTGDAYSTFADGDVGEYNHAMYAFGSAIGLDEDQLRKLYDAGVEADANGVDFHAAAKAWIKEKLEPDYHELDWTDPNLLMAIREQDTVLDCMKEFVGLFGPDIESRCTDEDVIRSLGMAYLIEAGADEDYLKWYLSDPQGDPRDYAIEHMGWIRVDGDSFQMWKFTDSELSEIRNFDGWPEEDDDDNELKSSSQEVGIEELSTNKHFSVPLRMLFDEQFGAAEITALMEDDEAFEKYERANKHYEGEDHEHLSLNPPGELNKRTWRIVVTTATRRLRTDPQRSDLDACERAVNAALEESGINIGKLNSGQIGGLWADVLGSASNLDKLAKLGR